MKILVISNSGTTPNMVRGAFQQLNVSNVEVTSVSADDEITGQVTPETCVLVDWEYDPAVGAGMIKTSKEACDKAPVLILSAKAKAGTTFAGMKAGASGVVNKPIDAKDLVTAVAKALKNATEKKPSVNVEFINPFIDATRNVFSTMCGMEAHRKKLFLKDDHKMLGDVSGVMGLTGAATGSVVVSLPKALACKVVGKMLGMDMGAELNPDVCDGVGEVINMIAGQAKAMLVKTKYHFTISIPSVVSGQGHEITHRKGTPNIVVLFETEGMDFALQVCLAPTESSE